MAVQTTEYNSRTGQTVGGKDMINLAPGQLQIGDERSKDGEDVGGLCNRPPI
jgi:hypothetical protein